MAVNTPYCHPVVFQAVPFAPLFNRLLHHAGKTSGPMCSTISCKLLLLSPSTPSEGRWWYWPPFWLDALILLVPWTVPLCANSVFLWLNCVRIEQQIYDNSTTLFIFVAKCVTCFKMISRARQMLLHSWIAVVLPIQCKW